MIAGFAVDNDNDEGIDTLSSFEILTPFEKPGLQKFHRKCLLVCPSTVKSVFFCLKPGKSSNLMSNQTPFLSDRRPAVHSAKLLNHVTLKTNFTVQCCMLHV